MQSIAKIHVPPAVLEACQYFMPRLMFLNSTLAPQIHWGDLATALNNFPEDLCDISTAEFWNEWSKRWIAHAEYYINQAKLLGTASGQRRFYRSAAACYHWAEFMYFDDQTLKTQCREKIKEYFRKSIDQTKLNITTGVTHYEGIEIPYYFIRPDVDEDHEDLPCVILSNGLDSVTEVEILSFAEFFLAQGFAVLLFDGPGQGINLGVNPIDLHFERVVLTLVELLRELPSIDHNRLAFFGVSFGGYIALRVAQHIGEHFKAIVNYSGGPSFTPFDQMKRRLKDDFQYAFMEPDISKMQSIFDQLTLDPTRQSKPKILSVHGRQDDIFPIEALKSMIGLPGGNHELQIYLGEPHVCLNYINENSVKIAEWLRDNV